MNNRSAIQLWGARAKVLSRIWICSHCGAKVYCGRLTDRPSYRCLCGKTAWSQLDRAPLVDKFP